MSTWAEEQAEAAEKRLEFRIDNAETVAEERALDRASRMDGRIQHYPEGWREP